MKEFILKDVDFILTQLEAKIEIDLEKTKELRKRLKKAQKKVELLEKWVIGKVQWFSKEEERIC